MARRSTSNAVLVVSLLLGAVACASNRDDAAIVESRSGDAVVAQLPDLAARFVDAVFRIETEGCGWIGSGSGFAIDAHHVVTNHHVVATDSSPIVRARDGRAITGRVVGSTERPDLAVIEVADDLPTTVTWADTAAVQRDEALVVMGFPVPERTFKISTGAVIGFQPPNSRDALIANTPIDRGNSGGPALRRDGTVAGVVTEMATKDDDGQRVAIVFTSNSVRATAQRFIDAPTEVLSSCGLGPDYVPQVPTDFELPPLSEIPAPSARPTQSELDEVYAPTAYPDMATVPTTVLPAPTTAPCPSTDGIVVELTETAVDPGANENEAIATVSGTISNSTPYAVQVDEVLVRFGPEAPDHAYAIVEPPVLAPGANRPWTVTATLPAGQVVTVEARVQWTWADPLVTRCGAPDKRDTHRVGTDEAVPPVQS